MNFEYLLLFHDVISPCSQHDLSCSRHRFGHGLNSLNPDYDDSLLFNSDSLLDQDQIAHLLLFDRWVVLGDVDPGPSEWFPSHGNVDGSSLSPSLGLVAIGLINSAILPWILIGSSRHPRSSLPTFYPSIIPLPFLLLCFSSLSIFLSFFSSSELHSLSTPFLNLYFINPL